MPDPTTLVVERKDQPDKTPTFGGLSLTPAIDEGYWSYRVVLSERQAVVAFPKFFTVGIGFAVEEDWNTNLPYTCEAEEIAEHILHNKGDDSISDDAVVEAIRLLKDAVAQDVAEAEAS